MKIMVGMSTANGKTVLGKVSILNNGATGGFDTTVVANYVTPYNAAPSETTLANVKCGATAAATAIKMIVSEAKDLYESGGTVEDIDGEIKTLFDTLLFPIRDGGRYHGQDLCDEVLCGLFRCGEDHLSRQRLPLKWFDERWQRHHLARSAISGGIAAPTLWQDCERQERRSILPPI
jgi:hypothetical protein